MVSGLVFGTPDAADRRCKKQVPLQRLVELRTSIEVSPAKGHTPVLVKDRALQAFDEAVGPCVTGFLTCVTDTQALTGFIKRSLELASPIGQDSLLLETPRRAATSCTDGPFSVTWSHRLILEFWRISLLIHWSPLGASKIASEVSTVPGRFHVLPSQGQGPVSVETNHRLG